jgi:hypothetical protein
MITLLRSKTGEIYSYLGNESYENITKGGKGKVRDEDASKVFVIPLCLNSMCNKNENIVRLIKELNMCIEPNDDNLTK